MGTSSFQRINNNLLHRINNSGIAGSNINTQNDDGIDARVIYQDGSNGIHRLMFAINADLEKNHYIHLVFTLNMNERIDNSMQLTINAENNTTYDRFESGQAYVQSQQHNVEQTVSIEDLLQQYPVLTQMMEVLEEGLNAAKQEFDPNHQWPELSIPQIFATTALAESAEELLNQRSTRQASSLQ